MAKDKWPGRYVCSVCGHWHTHDEGCSRRVLAAIEAANTRMGNEDMSSSPCALTDPSNRCFASKLRDAMAFCRGDLP